MNKNQETKEKTCTFFASDYHFEMISLPYIEKKLSEDNEIVVLTENDLEDTINVLISRTNLGEEKKNKILNIDWNNDDLNKFKKIESDVRNKKDIVIFIKGKKNYINNVNKNIEKWVGSYEKSKIIDCYDIDEINKNIDKIADNYVNILNTKGESKIQKSEK